MLTPAVAMHGGNVDSNGGGQRLVQTRNQRQSTGERRKIGVKL